MTDKIVGVDILLLAEIDGVFKTIGGQRGATLSESRATIPVSNKLSPGAYEEHEYGFGSWNISGDGVYVENEEGYAYLVTAMRNRTKIKVRWQEAGSAIYEGMALVTSRDLEGPYEGEATYSMDLQGDGQPTLTDGTLSGPLTAMVVKEETLGATLTLIPAFSGSVLEYATVADADSTYVKVTPTGPGVIKVNGVTVATTVESGEIPLGTAGSLTKVIVSVKEENKVARNYVITVARSSS